MSPMLGSTTINNVNNVLIKEHLDLLKQKPTMQFITEIVQLSTKVLGAKNIRYHIYYYKLTSASLISSSLSLSVSLVLQTLFCMTNNNMLLNLNESSLPSTVQLRSLQEILHNRIIQKKMETHPSYNKVYNDSLWTEIKALQWVSAQILTLLRQQQPPRVSSTFLFSVKYTQYNIVFQKWFKTFEESTGLILIVKSY